jgi:hypothetical protein
MKRAFKILGWLLVVLIVLIAAAAVTLKIMFPKEKIKAMVLQKAEAALHRQVRIGDVSLSLFSGLKLSEVEVSERPDFQRGTFLTAEALYVQPQILPLFSRKLYVDVIELHKPAISVVREKDGVTFNFSDLTGTSSAPVPAVTTSTLPSQSAPTTASPSPFAFLVSKAVIEKGQIAFVDHSTAAISATLSNVDLSVRNITLAGPVNLTLGLDAAFKGLQARLDTKSSVSWLRGVASVETLEVVTGQTRLQVAGQITGLKETPAFDLKWTLTDFDPLVLKPLNALPPEVKLSGRAKGNGTVKGTSERGELAALIDARDMEVFYGTAAFHKKPAVPLQLAAKGTYQMPLTVLLSEVQLTLAKLVLKGPATYSSRGYEAKLQSNEFPLEDIVSLVPAMRDISFSGPAVLAAKIKSTAADPDVQGTLQLKNAAASTGDIRVAGIQSKIDFTAKDVAGTLTASQVKSANFVGDNLNVKWNLLNAADLAKLSGNAQLRLGPGNFNNFQQLMGQSKIARILLLPMRIINDASKLASKFGAKIPALEQVNYKTVEGLYDFRGGVMDIKKFELAATNLNAGIKGTVGLTGAQAIRAIATVQLAKGFVADVGEMSFRIEVGGTVEKPETKIDPIETGSQILKSLGKDPAKQVEKLLKGLFNNK